MLSEELKANVSSILEETKTNMNKWSFLSITEYLFLMIFYLWNINYLNDESNFLQLFEWLRTSSQFLWFLQIFLRLFFFPYKDIDLCNLIINLPITRLDLHILLKASQCLCKLACPLIQNSKVIMCDFVLRMDLQHFFIILNSFFELACMMQYLCQSL